MTYDRSKKTRDVETSRVFLRFVSDVIISLMEDHGRRHDMPDSQGIFSGQLHREAVHGIPGIVVRVGRLLHGRPVGLAAQHAWTTRRLRARMLLPPSSKVSDLQRGQAATA